MNTQSKMYVAGLFSLLVILITGCTAEQEPIAFGEDQCAYCKMGIVDPKYGAELVTRKGRVYKFDAMECLVQYENENKDSDYVQSLAVAYDDPGELHPLNQLSFLQSENFKSPMGSNTAAFVDPENSPFEAEQIQWSDFEKKYTSQ